MLSTKFFSSRLHAVMSSCLVASSYPCAHHKSKWKNGGLPPRINICIRWSYMESFASRGGASGSQNHYICLDDETYLLPLMAMIHIVLTA